MTVTLNNMKNGFIKATNEFNTFEAPVPAYYFRRSFNSDSAKKAKLSLAVCGFYQLYFNGRKLEKGFLAPYISNPDHYVYCDEYEITLDEGENVIGVILGNGFQNNPGGYIWQFDTASFRSAPMLSLTVTEAENDNSLPLLKSDSSFRIHESPIRSDDYRFGEHYDANYEIDGWAQKGFCDSDWENALTAEAPKGEIRVADIAPITKTEELAPVSIIKSGDGYIYDFGQSNAGVCRLRVKGEKGQKIELRHADCMKDGDIYLNNIWFVRDSWERDKRIVHLDTYVCSGVGVESYQPSFTYHGFRYVRVDGITEEQATPELLSYLVYHTKLDTKGDFTCSDPVATLLQEMTRRSITSNFHHFPTDCPQREKNGWTADAALSCEAALINFDPERNYREWLRNICKAQREDGALPGIVPTGGWGFSWGNGPAWDCVLAYLPYFVYIYRGETEMISESAEEFVKYLRYLRTRVDEKGLLHIGLGDWCHVGGLSPKSPLILTDSVMAMDIASKIAHMLGAIGMTEGQEYARGEYEKYRAAIRENLLDRATMRAIGECQTSQAMCLFYGVFEQDEREAAFAELLKMIRDFDDHIDVGVLGGRVIFHVLSEFGYDDLAFRMITREDYPSYGNWIKRGATTLWEDFFPDRVSSMNHHFWGDISAYFIKSLAGIRLNPHKNNVRELEIRPAFIDALNSVSAYHIAPAGKISVSWEKTAEGILLRVDIPEEICATIILPSAFRFADSDSSKRRITTGAYLIIR